MGGAVLLREDVITRPAMAAAVLTCALVGCSLAGPTVTLPTTTPELTASPRALSAPTPVPHTFSLGASQVRMLETLTAFLRAYNAGQVSAALFWLSDDVAISDCDYKAVRVTLANGANEAAQWLRARAAEHDHLMVEKVENSNPDPATGSHVVAVSYMSRTSDTLASLGFPNGILPQTATKVVLNEANDRIRAFANGPFGGDQELCRAK